MYKPEIINAPSGKTYSIAWQDQMFLHKLRRLSVEDKFHLLEVSEIDIIIHFEKTKAAKVTAILNLFSEKWYALESGDLFLFDDEYVNEEFFGIKQTKKQIKGRLQRDTLSYQNILNILDWFTSQDELTTEL